jgi:hypothetical protein
MLRARRTACAAAQAVRRALCWHGRCVPPLVRFPCTSTAMTMRPSALLLCLALLGCSDPSGPSYDYHAYTGDWTIRPTAALTGCWTTAATLTLRVPAATAESADHGVLNLLGGVQWGLNANPTRTVTGHLNLAESTFRMKLWWNGPEPEFSGTIVNGQLRGTLDFPAGTMGGRACYGEATGTR